MKIKKITILALVIVIMASLLSFSSGCTTNQNGVLKVKTSDVATLYLHRNAKGDNTHTFITVTDQAIIQQIFNTINTVEYTKTNIILGNPQGYYTIILHDSSDNLIKKVEITKENEIIVGGWYYATEGTVPFSSYEAYLD